MKDATKSEAGWLPLMQCVAAFGMTAQGFHKEVRPLLDPADVRGSGKRGVSIRLRGAIDAYIRDRITKAAPVATDPLLAGSDSPNLERYRAARADLAEIELEERRGTHIDLGQIDSALMRFASIIRRAGEAIQRHWGNDASDLLNEAIDEAVSQWQSTPETTE